MEGVKPAADLHVHTQWSWDAEHGSMAESCRQAVALGLPAIAFTDHADFTDYVKERDGLLDIVGYLDCVERCRAVFPELRILSGVELGEPHRFAAEAEAILAAGPLDRVLGSVHCLQVGDELLDASTKGLFDAGRAVPLMRIYLAETLALIESRQRFDVLAHLDYPKRYWPHGEVPFREGDFEEEYRAVLVAAAGRELVLEVNTTRGADPARGLCPGPTVLGWWREAGGRAVSLGSDAHSPGKIAAGFQEASAVVEAAGFRPARHPTDFWRR
jgi:histidinol-phosphatase (PHP family)